MIHRESITHSQKINLLTGTLGVRTEMKLSALLSDAPKEIVANFQTPSVVESCLLSVGS